MAWFPPVLGIQQPLSLNMPSFNASSLLVGDRYLSPTGNDSNDGLTRDTAWATPTALNTWIAGLAAGTHKAVILSGSYTVTEKIAFTRSGGTQAVNLTIEFEESVTWDSSAAVVRVDGFDLADAPNATVTVNLRGAVFTGNNAGSANGIGTTGNIGIVINGAASDGTNAIFQGYDDGISFHGTSGAVDKIIVNDCTFRNCVKGAFVHVNSARGTHNRCRFEGRTGASTGIGSDGSTVKSIFNDCDFVPAASGQQGGPTVANRCRIGTLSLMIDQGNQTGQSLQFTDCFLNLQFDGPGNYTMTRCYGYFNCDRIRGTSADAATFTNCVFEGRTNSIGFMASDFGSNDGNWLGGSPVFRDCVIFDYGTAFGFLAAATWQRDHINANWTVDHCCLFENTANFAAGITIGTDLLLSDPLLSANRTTSMSQSDWAVGSGSPCIGAGSTGGNIGFTLADIVQ